MKIHPAANVFPMMARDELQELADDILEHGLRMPIELLEGEIIDGRNRFEACVLNELEPEFVDVKNIGDPFEYVVSLNERRRHLTESQRAMVAAKIAKAKVGQPKKNRAHVRDKSISTNKNAAEMMSIGTRSVQNGKKVLANGSSKLVEAVESGAVAVADAVKIVDQPKKTQNKAVQAVKKGAAKTVAKAVAKQDEAAPEKSEFPEWWQNRSAVDEYRKEINRLIKKIKDIDSSISGFEELAKNRSRIKLDLENVKAAIVGSVPFEICPYCYGIPEDCAGCSERGWVGKGQWNQAPEELRNEVERLSDGGTS